MYGALGYVALTRHLAVLTVNIIITLRARPAFPLMFFGIQNLRIVPGEPASFCSARRMNQVGIKIEYPGRPAYYFWPRKERDLAAILAAVTDLGFEVSMHEYELKRLR
jgi:hypothetical protein